ncbi:acyl-CoA dehydrogenase family protein [Haladaptatus sp. GCM10025707]|uniref:acyl-CoA dehydrogenase family protein n=1 Tax=unclassified Haladaptatus TaxID=2622732 RepID=UPI0023E89B46|nr:MULTISPECIES: acyl-CoA dehydrogenase family protein [unclassified Haladaptatus]
MAFRLTNEQRVLRDDVREFATEEIEPVARELDDAGDYPEAILAELGDRRLTGLTLPEEYGGRDEGLVEFCIVIEELAAAMMPVASALALHLGVATVVERFGNDDLKESLLPEMARFETVGALGLSEANAGSDKLAMETTAERDGDEWVVTGHKQWVTNFFEADYVLTYAKTGPEEAAPENISAFLIPTDEFEVETVWDTLGARSVPSPKVTLDSVRVPDTRRVGETGMAYVERKTITNGVNVPARGVGIARAALEKTVAHTSQREQFGRPLSDKQGLRWRVGEMATRVDAARLLTLHAADRADRGVPLDGALHMAKIHATEAAVENANEAMQLHGGIGYTTERHVERYLRDAKLLTIAGGPNEGHRDALAAAVYDTRR